MTKEQAKEIVDTIKIMINSGSRVEMTDDENAYMTSYEAEKLLIELLTNLK